MNDQRETESKKWGGYFKGITSGNAMRTGIGIILFALIVLSGCSGILDTETVESPSASTPTPNNVTDTATSTQTATVTTTATETQTPNYSTKEKYSYFRDGYVEGAESAGVNVVNNSLDPENETLHLTYEMRNPENDQYTGNERENVSLRYVAATDFYLNGNVSELDGSWIPKQVNVTAVTPEGERYETAYTTFERAKEMIDGEITAKRYLLEYYGTIEPGPANPEYEG